MAPDTAPGAPRATLDRRLCVAPMLDWTTRHCRYFLRLLSRRTLLYTEMVTSAALLRGDAARHLAHEQAERPLALQLGGADPRALAACAALGEGHGFDEINLNVGCPSDRVQAGRFGVRLMTEPALVAECVGAMRAQVRIPVTVKTRIGVDEHDSYAFLAAFVAHLRDAGCDALIVHARKAWLQGLSPKDNRTIPPLVHARVHRLKRDFPDLPIVINGGITTLEDAAAQLRLVDGVMIGRRICHDPWLLAGADRRIFGAGTPVPSRAAVLDAYRRYAERQLDAGASLPALTRHLLGLFQGRPGARRWRRSLSGEALRAGAGAEVLDAALAALAPGVLDA